MVVLDAAVSTNRTPQRVNIFVITIPDSRLADEVFLLEIAAVLSPVKGAPRWYERVEGLEWKENWH